MVKWQVVQVPQRDTKFLLVPAFGISIKQDVLLTLIVVTLQSNSTIGLDWLQTLS